MSFKSKKIFTLYLLFALIGSQFALAQHSILHFDLHSQTTQQNSDNSDYDGTTCHSCIAAKNLANELIPQADNYFLIVKADLQAFYLQEFANLQSLNKPFSSQGPPRNFS